MKFSVHASHTHRVLRLHWVKAKNARTLLLFQLQSFRIILFGSTFFVQKKKWPNILRAALHSQAVRQKCLKIWRGEEKEVSIFTRQKFHYWIGCIKLFISSKLAVLLFVKFIFFFIIYNKQQNYTTHFLNPALFI